MNINKNNYEAFFLDYHEGNLTPQQVVDLLFFVEMNPELKEEFEGFENFTIEDFPSVEFEYKSSLKKEITLDNREVYFIKSVENTLNTSEKSLLDIFLKQNPQFMVEYELFQKTKLAADKSVVFENKNSLKKSFSSSTCIENVFQESNIEEDNSLIAAIEGLLTKEETLLLNQQLNVDVQKKKNYFLYQQTKSIADPTIKFDDKESLKHRKNKAIPLYFYISVAATILLFFGLFFLFNNNRLKTDLAIIAPKTGYDTQIISGKLIALEKKDEKKDVQKNVSGSFIQKKNGFGNKKRIYKEVIMAAPIAEKQLPQSIELVGQLPLVKVNDSLLIKSINTELPINNSDVIAQIKQKNEVSKPSEFISFRELASEKIKEKLLDKNTINEQKKTGRLKKISGWDIAQAITTGISKLTGRNVKLEPHYNDEGSVSAYAISAGEFQFSRGR